MTFIPKHFHKRAAVSMLATNLKQNSLTPEPSPFSLFTRLVYCKGIKIKWACDKENKCYKKLASTYIKKIVKKRRHHNIHVLWSVRKKECWYKHLPEVRRREEWWRIPIKVPEEQRHIQSAAVPPLLWFRSGLLGAKGSGWQFLCWESLYLQTYVWKFLLWAHH